MSSLRTHTIDPALSPRLRVGIKWDALERDDIDECHELGSAEEARKAYALLTREIASARFTEKLLKISPIFNKQRDKVRRSREQKITHQKVLKKYIAQEKLLSYDLDLCCFCADAEGRMVEFIAPNAMETTNLRQSQKAFMHSGDHTTGTSRLFDEELLIDLRAINPAVQSMVFAMISVNHTFDEIKGGQWAIINTSGEVEIMAATLVTQAKHNLHIIAKLSRADAGWCLTEIGDYAALDTDEKVPLHIRMDAVLAAHK